MALILLIVLGIVIFASLPRYGYSRDWGYRPAGFLGLLFGGRGGSGADWFNPVGLPHSVRGQSPARGD